MKPTFKLLIPAVMAFSLVACGGSSSGGSSSGGSGTTASNYSGKTTPAAFKTLSEEEQQEIGESSAAVAIEAANIANGDYGDLPFGGVIEENTQNDHEKAQEIIQRSSRKANEFLSQQNIDLGNLPIAIKETFSEDCDSGNVKAQININDSTGHGTVSISYNNCRDNYGGDNYDIYNGTISFQSSYNNSTDKTTTKAEFKNYEEFEVWGGDKYDFKMNGFYEITFDGNYAFLDGFLDDDDCDYDDNDCWDDFDIIDYDSLHYTAKWNLNGSEDGQKISSVGEMTCNPKGCSISSDIEGKDGKVFRVKDLKISYNELSYTEELSGTMYHPDYGHYTFELSMNSPCWDDAPSPFTGTATFTDEDGATIRYDSTDCSTEPTITIN